MTESDSRRSQFLSFIGRLSQSARENADVLGWYSLDRQLKHLEQMNGPIMISSSS